MPRQRLPGKARARAAVGHTVESASLHRDAYKRFTDCRSMFGADLSPHLSSSLDEEESEQQPSKEPSTSLTKHLNRMIHVSIPALTWLSLPPAVPLLDPPPLDSAFSFDHLDNPAKSPSVFFSGLQCNSCSRTLESRRNSHGRNNHGRNNHGRNSHGRNNHERNNHERNNHGRNNHGRRKTRTKR